MQLALVVMGSGLLAGDALSQVPPHVGGSGAANPTMATQRMEHLGMPRPALPSLPKEPEVKVPAERVEPGLDSEAQLFVKRVQFEGSTALSPAELSAIAASFENRKVTLRELNVLARRVRFLYRKRGYPVADVIVPAQTVEGGVVRLVISEGRYGKVETRGNRHYSTRFVQRFFEPAMERGLVYSPSLYRSLLILNEFSDLQVQAEFAPGRELGTTDVTLNVRDARPFHVGLDYNNFGNRLVGRNRLGVGVWGGNAFTDGDMLTLHLVEPFPGRSKLAVEAGYGIPVGNRGTKVQLQFASNVTIAGAELAPLDIRGEADIYGLFVSHPLKRTLSSVQNVTAGLAAKTVRNFVFDNTRLSQDELREFVVTHDGIEADRKGRLLHSVTLTQGLGTALGGRANGDPLSSRVGSGDQFTKLSGEFIRTQEVDRKSFMLYRLTAQLTGQPLTVAELFPVGGPDSVRGFIQSEYLADLGYTASAEYRRQVWQSSSRRDMVQAVAFIDHGTGQLKLPQVGEFSSRSLTGAGVGLRAALRRDASIRLDVGFPIAPDKNVDGHDAILYALASKRF